jgi:hypothetical protein
MGLDTAGSPADDVCGSLVPLRGAEVAGGSAEHQDDYAHLVGFITQELEAISAIRELELADDLIDDLAGFIATNIHYAFEYRLRDETRHMPVHRPRAS